MMVQKTEQRALLFSKFQSISTYFMTIIANTAISSTPESKSWLKYTLQCKIINNFTRTLYFRKKTLMLNFFMHVKNTDNSLLLFLILIQKLLRANYFSGISFQVSFYLYIEVTFEDGGHLWVPLNAPKNISLMPLVT